MMGVRKDYKRWDYDDETEITMEEQLTLEENPDSNSLGGGTDSLNSSSFPPPNIVLSSSPIRNREVKRSRKATTKEKVQLLAISSGVILLGFFAGFFVGVKERNSKEVSRHPNKHHTGAATIDSTGNADTLTGGSIFHENPETFYHDVVNGIKGENIRRSMQRMSQEEHQAGTPEGKSMAYAVRDLWRGFGVSVRIEQHKTKITRTDSFNFVEVLDGNGTVVFTTSKIGDDVNLPNSKPLVAFSPSGNCSGTLIYGHYGRLQDLQLLRKSQIPLNGSIALIRFGSLHPSNVVTNAMAFGLKGIIFYPDPQDFGPLLPSVAVRRASLLTVGQVHEFQKHKESWSIPCHTISSNDAKKLVGTLAATTPAPKQWQGGLGISYFLGGPRIHQQQHQQNSGANGASSNESAAMSGNETVRLQVFNEAKLSTIYNVIAAIPGTMESDRYVILGCSHDSWTYGAADPGNSLAMSTEILRVFSSAVAAGWKPRRSILFISWDANLHAASGVSRWLQEHHFEIMSRTVAYVDLGRALQGNETLQVYSSPLLKEVVRKAIGRSGKHSHSSSKNAFSAPSSSLPPSSSPSSSTPGKSSTYPNVQFMSGVRSDEPSFAFLGNLGIPFIHLCVTNAPKRYDYPLFNTAFDTYENFVEMIDPHFKSSETLARVIAQITFLLSDSSALPITLQDYIKELRKEFDHFMAEYQEDFHKANLSLAYLQAGMMRLEVIANSFKAEIHNHSKNGNDMLDTSTGPHHKLRREMYHRMLNDKFMLFEKAMLSRSPVTDGYRHQIIGYASWLASANAKKTPFNSLRARRESQHSSHTSVVAGSATTTTASNGKALSLSYSPSSATHQQNSSSADSFPLPLHRDNPATTGNGSSGSNGKSISSSAATTSEAHLGKGFPFPPSSLLLSTATGDVPRVFPELRVVFDCGRNCEKGLNQGDVCSDYYSTFFSSGGSNSGNNDSNNSSSTTRSSSSCSSWKEIAGQKVTSLVRSLDAASAVIQSPLVPRSRE